MLCVKVRVEPCHRAGLRKRSARTFPAGSRTHKDEPSQSSFGYEAVSAR
jgi:hypothetical protein